MKMGKEEKIESRRKEIDALDGEILSLLNKRAEIALELGKIKSEINMDTYNPQREETVLRRLETENSGVFPRWAIRSVYREVISACRALQAELTVAFLGPPATYSQLACIQHFGNSVRMVPENTIQDVFDAVEREEADYGVVPIENSTEGPVSQTLDMFIKSEVKICGEVLTRISHDLLSRSGRSEDIQKIYSHPQALAQCREWLRKNFPHVQLEEAGSTAKAAQIATEIPGAAAISSSIAAHLYGLKAVASQIEDNLQNFTRFLILGRREAERTGRDKTSLLFSVAHAPGTLFRVLQTFYEKNINLTKIESRPTKGKPWEYVFFIDFEGHSRDPNIAETLTKLKEQVFFVKVLGSYPQDSQER